MLQADSRSLAGAGRGTADLVVTSPPYPMIGMWDALFSRLNARVGRELSSGNADKAFELMHAELDPVWRGIYAALREGGIACIVVGDATRKADGLFRLFPNHSRILESCRLAGFHVLPGILWRKQSNKPNKFMGSGMMPPSAYPTLEHEHILVMRKGAARHFSTAAERSTRRRSAFFWEERNLWFSDVWEDVKGERQTAGAGSPRVRSASFPAGLARRLICMFSLQGDTVLDPFAGSGTTCLAAAECARNSVGLELEGQLALTARANLRGAVRGSRNFTSSRVQSHLDYVAECERRGRNLGYVSSRYGFPVTTSQETDIELPCASSTAESDDGSVTVDYEA